ncbi:hypothetical protein Y032_0425g1226 [Ancylostoma ceylanicum]|uniref:Uncharacterized protein n=1 Tax=Ancylostoma ceylanicum TaxID=53326 RepID=A0A016X0A3_9BILA|nr:hypothetical protein Y032_0425g1226 [Ancylostoma ceylanicum]
MLILVMFCSYADVSSVMRHGSVRCTDRNHVTVFAREDIAADEENRFEKQYAERARRMSTLSRSDAIQGYHPVKQNSNPLPEPRIYERGHEHSRSWNVESVHSMSPSPPHQQNDYQYYQVDEVYPQERPYIPTINEPPSHLGVRQLYRQAKSFDDRGGPRENRRMSMDRRTLSEAERSAARQHTAQHLQPETPVAAACQSLWAAKGHLEELHALGISDPSSASTSFESNTDNSPAPGNSESKERDEGADKKRLQYKASNQFHRRIENQSPTRRSSHESDASRELRELFSRRSSQLVDSRKTSRSSAVIGDRRPSRDSRRDSIFDNLSRRPSRDLRDFNRDRRRYSRDLFYDRDRDLDSRRSSGDRRESQPRRQSQDIRDFYMRRGSRGGDSDRRDSRDEPNHDRDFDSRRSSTDRRGSQSRRQSQDIRDFYMHRDHRARRSSRDFVYGVQSRKVSRELPMVPTVEVSEAQSRRNSRMYDDRRFSRDMSPLYERNENRERRRRRSSFIRHVAVSHDANFWAREQSPDRDGRDGRSLFLRRKFLSTAAVSSLDSNSTESSAPEAIFASSVDSAGSDLEHRRLSLLNRIPTGSVPHMALRQAPSINPPPNSQRRRLQNRDYSVDAQSDTLFREWSRVDPAYEGRDAREHRDPRRRLERGVSEDQSSLRPVRARAYSRQLTANPGGNVMVPFICYPDEVNCSR